jgi:phosphatidylserine/phosphatidylglycerophosphate/cardiolipin synthase-like enzyme
VHFRLDDQVPFGACHHQKVLVIDDEIAFCGGADLCVDRWDTPGHLDHDRRRIMPDQECHAPRHEVMMMVDGAAARALGDHFRARWAAGAGEGPMIPPPDAGGDPWPDHVPAHLIHLQVGIARTQPAWRGQPGHDEIARLALASIAAAKDTIYLENQYFTSPVITEALARRLGEPDGPEVVLIVTGVSPSWFDQATMDHARAAMVWRLRAADVFGRFRALYPITRQGVKIIVHSKTSVFDDRLVRVGSANLNNRSLGFDTEIELAAPADDPETRVHVAAFRDRLVGHFIGVTGDAVAKARTDMGGLVAAIDHLNRDGRLQSIDPRRSGPIHEFFANLHLGDPSDPGDSWLPFRRRERLFRQARALAAPAEAPPR